MAKLKLICLQDILSKDEFVKFLVMIQKKYPEVYDAWMKNTKAYTDYLREK